MELIRFRELVGKNITRIYIYILSSYRDNENYTWRFELFIVRLFRMNGLFYRRRKIADILEEILNSYLRPKICRFEIDEQRVSPLDSTIYFERRIGNAVPSTTISICSEGKERGEREEFWREECRKARIEFREQTSTIVVVVVVVFLRVRARTGATPSPRSKAKYSGGTLTDEIVCNLGRVWPTPPTLSPTRESFFDVGRKRYPLCAEREREREPEISRDNGGTRNAYTPVSNTRKLQLFCPRSPSKLLF